VRCFSKSRGSLWKLYTCESASNRAYDDVSKHVPEIFKRLENGTTDRPFK